MPHTHRPRPILDPELPAEAAARLRRDLGRLPPGGEAPPRWPASPALRFAVRAAPLLLTVGLAPLALYSGTAALVLFFLTALLVTCVARLALSDDFDAYDLFSALLLTPLAAIPLFLLSGLVESGLAALGIPTGGLGADDGSLASMRVPVAVLLVLAGAGTTWWLSHTTRPAVLASVYHGHYLVEEDFGDRFPTAEAETVIAVQRAVDQVREGTRVLGDSFDATAALVLLREQQWRIAQDLLRHRRHRLALEERRREAVTDRVRDALRPQEEAVRTSWKAITERADALTRYGRSVHDAVTAHREWQQCEDIARHNNTYADLVASSTTGTLDTEALDADTTRLEAARQARDHRIREAAQAGEWLTRALR